jgi:DNA-binding PadR family transcriptional regulator
MSFLEKTSNVNIFKRIINIIMDTKIYEIIDNLDKTFNNMHRYYIMSLLIKNEKFNYSSLQNILKLSCGALSYHLNYLEKAKYIIVEREFVNRKPNSSYTLTELGKKSFNECKNALSLLINM